MAMIGAPPRGFGMSNGLQAPQSSSASMFNMNVPNVALPAGQPKPHFFGQGGGGRAIAGAIGDYLLQMNHMDPIYAKAMAEQSALERGDQQYQLHRRDANDDWLSHQQYEDAHRQPTGYGGQLAEAGYAPGTSDYSRRMQAHVNGDDAFITVPLPDGRTFSGSRADYLKLFGGGNAPSGPTGPLTPIAGGPTPQASGNFR